MSGAWLLVFYLLVPLEAYLGVTNVTFVDTASVFGFIGGVISWTPPSDLTHVTGYRAWLGVNEDSELADFFNGLAQGLGET
ncbi:unnamed protein product [Effrenium voratum]|nr:unnamed protein product [Effrenium voratum]